MNYLFLIPGFLLGIAVLKLPYDYYTILRIVVTIFSISIILKEYKKNIIIGVVFLFIAYLFNPVIPVHLSKDSWIFIDIICSITFCSYAIYGEKIDSFLNKKRT